MNYFGTALRSLYPATLLACITIAAMPLQAQTETPGFYATVYAQSSWLSSTDFDERGSAGFGSGLKAEFDGGIGFGGDFGYAYGNGWAAEFEWNWRRHDLQSLRRAGATLVTDGDFASNILFLNGVRRFTSSSRSWVPYAGAGLGWVQEIDFDLNSGPAERAWADQGAFGVQLMAGAEIPLSDSWRLTADVRLLRVGSVELPAEEGVTGLLAEPDYNPFSVQIGLRRKF
jgi:opacity protein-like surface antigen